MNNPTFKIFQRLSTRDTIPDTLGCDPAKTWWMYNSVAPLPAPLWPVLGYYMEHPETALWCYRATDLKALKAACNPHLAERFIRRAPQGIDPSLSIGIVEFDPNIAPGDGMTKAERASLAAQGFKFPEPTGEAA
jgi:hypothetical protein